MKLSIVVVALNEEAVIADCLEHIRAEGARSGAIYEIIVADNGSKDRTAEIAHNAGAYVAYEPRRGITRARNAGLHAAGGSIVAFLDADNCMPPGWIARVLRDFDEPNVVAVSGPYRYHDIGRGATAMVTTFNAITWALARVGFPMLQGGNFAARRWAMDSIQGFDESIDFYGDDTDVARRIAKLGRIKWRWDNYIWSSGRRLNTEGVVSTGLRYALNWASILARGRPATRTHRDIRNP